MQWSCKSAIQKKRKKRKVMKKKTLIYSICQCLWCKYFYHDRVQAVDRNMKSRNSELGRFMCKWLSCAGHSIFSCGFSYLLPCIRTGEHISVLTPLRACQFHKHKGNVVFIFIFIKCLAQRQNLVNVY